MHLDTTTQLSSRTRTQFYVFKVTQGREVNSSAPKLEEDLAKHWIFNQYGLDSDNLFISEIDQLLFIQWRSRMSKLQTCVLVLMHLLVQF